MRIEENISLFGKVSVNFLEISKVVFNLYEGTNEIERQKETPHLGLISKAFVGINHSRWEYLILQCVISEIIDNNNKGTSNTQGSITINKEEFFGNDIIKSWILLSNFGHCKNTIGDEKSILLHCTQSKKFKNFLINSIKDEDLKKFSIKVIEDFDYVNFHHVLSIYRIFKNTKKKIFLREKLLNIYKILLLPIKEIENIANGVKSQQLRSIYRIIRNVCIISLDSRNSSLPINIDILSIILSYNFTENRYNESTIDLILNPILSSLYETLYLNEQSQLFQRDYEIKANLSLNKLTNVESFKLAIENAIHLGLSSDFNCNYSHFLRVKLNSKYVEKSKFSEILRTALTIRRELSEIAEASVDINPFSKDYFFDFYFSKNKFNKSHMVKYLQNIEGVLDKQIIGTIDQSIDEYKPIISRLGKEFNSREYYKDIVEALKKELSNIAIEKVKKENLQTYKSILWSFLRFHFKERYYFDIEHHINDEYNFFGVKISDGLDILTSQLNKSINLEKDLDRKHELLQLQKGVSRKFDGVIIACLNRIIIYDYSQPPSKRMVTDIDSLILKFNKNNIYFEIHESKNTKTAESEAKKDIKNKLSKVLDKSFNKYSIKTVRNMGAKVVYKY